MKVLKTISIFMMFMIIAVSCKKDVDMVDLSYITAPTNVTAVFDITQDNTGLVTIAPNADGVTLFKVTFGDVPDETPTTYSLNEKITHVYAEGTYNVGISAVGITGLSTQYNQDITVAFKAPEDLVVTIEYDATNPKIISVSATAKYATVMDIYFGDVPDEVPVTVVPEEIVTHTYAEPGDYLLTVIAKSGGTETTEYSETITISAASEPVELPITFESFAVNYSFENFGSAVSTVIDNPDPSGINESARVAEFLKPAGAETWAGSLLTLGMPIDFSTKKAFKMKVWSPKNGALVKLKVENLLDGTIAAEVDAFTTVANQWEELTFDFSAIDVSNEYQKIVFFFDFENPGDDAIYYFDDVKQVTASAPSILMIENFEGEAPVFTTFGNIPDVEVVANPDPSGVNTTANTAKMIKSEGAETWAGAFFEPGTVLDFDSYSKVNMKIWSPKSGIIVKVKLENEDASITHEVDVVNTTSNAWEQLVYDFSTAPAAAYVRIVVFFDFDNPGDGSEYYYDEIELANEGGGEPTFMIFEDFEGTPPVFTTFGNIPDAEVVPNPDQSGVNTTANTATLTKTTGCETWAGTFFTTTALDLDTYSKISVATWSPKSGITIKLKLENADASITHEVDLTNTTANAWEEMVYDLSDAPAADYVNVVIFFDFDNPGDDSVYYFDQYTLTN